MAAPSRPRASSPALPGELVEEILLRLPPDDPACFLRASLVCKTWSSAISLPSFRRRLHELHRRAPVLGFLHDWYDPDIPDFIPTTASPFSLAAPDRRCWRALDCRHGRAVFLSKGQDAQALLVWEAITGAQRRVPVPTTVHCSYPTAAVFCAADGCDHCGCHVGVPFCIVLVFAISGAYGTSAAARLYSSETGTWGKITSTIQCESGVCFSEFGSVLIQNSLFYFMSDSGLLVEYDLARHLLTVIDTPPDREPGPYVDRYNLMLAENGGALGLVMYLDMDLRFWSRDVRDSGHARWQLSRVIQLDNLHLFQPMVRIADSAVIILAFAEGANRIFFNTDFGLFMMDLQSERVREVCGNHGFCNLIPVVSFYTPVSHGKHQDTIPLNLIEEAAGEEWRGEQDNASQLDKASSATEEEYFVHTGIRDLTCNNCRRPGHFGRDCPSASTCNNCNLPGHFAAECTSKTVCWNCKKSGHIATECKNEALCHTCSKTGHLARDCPASGSNAKLCNNCFKPGHIAVDCTNDRACNNCRQPGHIARECNNDPVCNLCNVSGHLARSCPKTSTLASEIHGGPFRDISCRMCGQPGHISRNCMATVICDTCGGRGHMAYECPSARVFDRGVRRY